MLRIMLKSKIHRARVTDADLNYVGSLTVDPLLLEAANILEHEQVHLLNLHNGKRLETYILKGKRGSGEICVNGAAARLAEIGDLVIIATYALMEEGEVQNFNPRVVFVDEDNRLSPGEKQE